ncbi:MAG TPA: hypothetical protein VG937_38980 [Polyangiaceae bacterium]|nr:hypothetical protein [Polyangiaceae bacterium]
MSTLGMPALARADIPPPDSCTTADAACSNAGPEHNQPGQCAPAKCMRARPDGTITYDCLRCVSSAGNGGSGNGGGATITGGSGSTTGGTASSTGGSGSTTGGTSSSTGGSGSTTGGTSSSTGGGAQAGASGASSDGDDDGGCSMSPVTAQRGMAALMVALGLSVAFTVRRRR